jgi:hypothetical protein
MINLEGCGHDLSSWSLQGCDATWCQNPEDWTWPILGYYPVICLEAGGNHQKISIKRGTRTESEGSWTQGRSANHMTATFIEKTTFYRIKLPLISFLVIYVTIQCLTYVIFIHSFCCINSCVKIPHVRYTLEQWMFIHNTYVKSGSAGKIDCGINFRMFHYMILKFV